MSQDLETMLLGCVSWHQEAVDLIEKVNHPEVTKGSFQCGNKITVLEGRDFELFKAGVNWALSVIKNFPVKIDQGSGDDSE